MWTQADGVLAITYPAYHDRRHKGSIENALKRLPKDALNPRIIEHTEIPQDRYFRGAWRDITPELTIDIDRSAAEEIKLEKLRLVRNKRLNELDLETIRAVGAGDDTYRDEVEKLKQELRDLPKNIDLTKRTLLTLDELKRYNPGTLKKVPVRPKKKKLNKETSNDQDKTITGSKINKKHRNTKRTV